MLSDIFVTQKDQKHYSLTPATAPFLEEYDAGLISALSRKTYILNDNCAISVAGYADSILDFVLNAKTIANSSSESDIMNKLLELAAGFSDVQAIICCATPRDKGPDICYTTNGISTEMPYLGKVLAIGSGSEDLVKSLLKYSDHITADWTEPVEPMQVIFKASETLSSLKIHSEIINPLENISWGGFLELVYFDLYERKWKRGPKSLNLYIYAQQHADGMVDSTLLDRFIAYEPGKRFGSMLSTSFANETITLNYFTIHDCTDLDTNIAQQQTFSWIEWMPDLIVVTIFANVENRIYSSTSRIQNDRLSDVKFEIRQDKKISLGIEKTLQDDITSEFFRFLKSQNPVL